MFAARKSVEGGGWTLSDAICLMPNGKFAKKSRGGSPPPLFRRICPTTTPLEARNKICSFY